MIGRWAFVLCLLAACCPAPAATPAAAPTAVTPAAAPPSADPYAARAAHFIALAEQVEPSLTPLLVSIAGEVGGEMYKLAHRLKTRASAERKIRSIAAEQQRDPATIALDDALRYTLVVADEPPGHYLDTCKAVLARLEGHGHRLLRAKNYWPAGDNYSGINSVLRSPSGLDWELQFHTPASIDAQSKTRAMYEELRLRDTALDRKRALFDRMTEVWNEVPIPRGVLDPHALHPQADIVHRPRP